MAGRAATEVTSEGAAKVWDPLMPFAGSAFNNAHAVCYAMLAYQTAYLKAHYPVQFMAALLAVYRSKEDRVTAFIEECRRRKIKVLPPDVNKSLMDFNIEAEDPGRRTGQESRIRFGLAAIKGVGEACVEEIIRERQSGGPFTHLFEFMDRAKPCGVNRTALEALVKAGAFDGIEPNRRKLLDMLDAAVAFADNANRSRAAGQDSLFGGESADQSMPSYPVLPEAEPLSRTEALTYEKEVMGIYVSDHPLRGMERLINQASSHTCASVAEQEEGVSVRLAGVISGLRTIITKNTGQKMASLSLEDFSGQATVIVFASTYSKLQDYLVRDSVVKVRGVVMHRERPGNGGEKSIEVRLEEIEPLEPVLDLRTGSASPGIVNIKIHRATANQLKEVKNVLGKYPGEYDVLIQVMPEETHLPIFAPMSVCPSPELMEQLGKVLAHAEIEIAGEVSGSRAFVG